MPRKPKNEIPEGKALVDADSLEAMADNIAKISKAVASLKGPGKLNRRAMILLIRERSKAYGPVVTEKAVGQVLDSLETLEHAFVTPRPVKGKRS